MVPESLRMGKSGFNHVRLQWPAIGSIMFRRRLRLMACMTKIISNYCGPDSFASDYFSSAMQSPKNVSWPTSKKIAPSGGYLPYTQDMETAEMLKVGIAVKILSTISTQKSSR